MTDAPGNTGTAATATATLDKTAPSGYTIKADKAAVNATSGQATGFTFAGATTGTTYSFTVTSTGGTAAVTGSGSVTAAAQDVTGINVTSLLDGTLTYSVTLTDSAGNVGTTATAGSLLDRVAPSGYAIAANPAAINLAAASDAGFTLTGAELNATYSYTVTSSGGSGSVTGNGSVTAATRDSQRRNVSVLADGTLTFSLTLTDAAGNTGTTATATATLNTQVPSGYTIAADRTPINAGQAAATRLHLRQRRDGHDLRLHRHQQRRHRFRDRQRQRDRGRARHHRHQRHVAGRRQLDLQRQA